VFVSENTVKTHSSRVFDKLGARRRTQAVQLGKVASVDPVTSCRLLSYDFPACLTRIIPLGDAPEGADRLEWPTPTSMELPCDGSS
jgi:hypothetical protein